MESRDSDATRSIFTAGFMGIMNTVIILAPLAPEMQAKLAATLNPTVALCAFVAWRLFDRWDGREK